MDEKLQRKYLGMVHEKPGYIRLCTKGDLLKPSIDSGLGWTALGLKLCHIINFFWFW